MDRFNLNQTEGFSSGDEAVKSTNLKRLFILINVSSQVYQRKGIQCQEIVPYPQHGPLHYQLFLLAIIQKVDSVTTNDWLEGLSIESSLTCI